MYFSIPLFFHPIPNPSRQYSYLCMEKFVAKFSEHIYEFKIDKNTKCLEFLDYKYKINPIDFNRCFSLEGKISLSDLLSRSVQIDNHLSRPNLPKDCFYEDGAWDNLLFPEYYDIEELKKCGGIRRHYYYSNFSHPYTEEDFLNFIRNNKFISKDNCITKTKNIRILENSNTKTTSCCYINYFLGSFIDIRIFSGLSVSQITTLVKYIERNFILHEKV